MPVAIAPSPLAPGFPRTWPDARPAIQAITRHLLAWGAEDEEVLICLMMDFPDMQAATGAPWRSDAYFANVLAAEKMYLARRPDIAENMRGEPSGYELQVVSSAQEMIRLAGWYSTRIRLSETPGELKLSRVIQVGGAFHQVLKRFKPDLLEELAGVHG